MTAKAAKAAPAKVTMEDVGTLDSVLLAAIVGTAREARFTAYSTGSDGFRGVGKGTNESGHRYQITVQCVRIGSKDNQVTA